MTDPRSRRKLAAILSADVVGYSRLMAADEAATVETLKSYRDIIARLVVRHGGRVVNAPGDALLAEFPSAVEAVRAAVEVQKSLEGHNIDLEPERRMQFRIGVNLGDVIEEADGTIYGDGVNIAARMEALAEGGGVCISSTVYDAVEGKLSFGFDFLGEQQVKNIARPVRVYRVRAEPRTTPVRTGGWRRLSRRVRLPVIGAAALLLLIAAGALTWQVMRSRSPIADPVLALPKGPSIAVLPFSNLSGDTNQDYFSTGLTDDLITRLSRFPKYFVIARNSTEQYRGRAVDVREVGRNLGARYVIEGTVRRDADTLRVTAQLLDARNGAHLWADTYDRNLSASAIFAIQDEITEKIVGAIGSDSGVLSRVQFDQAAQKKTDNLTAYECVSRAVNYYNIITPEEHRAVRDCLEKSVAADPKYSDAWAWLTHMYLDEHKFSFNPRPDSLDRALATAKRAVELDETSQYAHEALASAYFFRHDLDRFRAEAERALALNPNESRVVAWMGALLLDSGSLDRGYHLVQKASALNPYHPRWYHLHNFIYWYSKNDYGAALSEVQKASLGLPDYYVTLYQTAAALGQLGRRDEAAPVIAKLLKVYPNFPSRARAELANWNYPPALIDLIMDGLRKAGLETPQS